MAIEQKTTLLLLKFCYSRVVGNSFQRTFWLLLSHVLIEVKLIESLQLITFISRIVILSISLYAVHISDVIYHNAAVIQLALSTIG